MICAFQNTAAVRSNLSDYEATMIETIYLPSNFVSLDEESYERLNTAIQNLEDLDEVHQVVFLLMPRCSTMPTPGMKTTIKVPPRI